MTDLTKQLTLTAPLNEHGYPLVTVEIARELEAFFAGGDTPALRDALAQLLRAAEARQEH